MQGQHKSTVDKIHGNRDTIKEKMRAREDKLEDYKKALNGVASSPNGEFVFKELVKAMGIFKVRQCREGAELVQEKALRDFYLSNIRPFLEKEIRFKIEE